MTKQGSFQEGKDDLILGIQQSISERNKGQNMTTLTFDKVNSHSEQQQILVKQK